MSRPAGPPRESITIRLLAEDIRYLRRVFPTGYQTKLNELIHTYVQQLQAEGEQTLGELERMYPNGK